MVRQALEILVVPGYGSSWTTGLSTTPGGSTRIGSRRASRSRSKKILFKEDGDEDFDLEEFAGRHYVADNAVNVSKFASREVNSSKECNPQDDSCARKTILTYEVHQSLLLDNVFSDLPEGSNSEGWTRNQSWMIFYRDC